VKQSDHFRENAENCAQLAERSEDEPTFKRYKRMEAAWRALAEEQDWLDGEAAPKKVARIMVLAREAIAEPDGALLTPLQRIRRLSKKARPAKKTQSAGRVKRYQSI
jgi:hypothetical protein